MNQNTSFTNILFNKLLSQKTKEQGEKVILWIAILGFVSHLIVIGLVDFDIIFSNKNTDLLKNPIAAIYTPFSFILIYEVYLLVYYLPKSTTSYIGKQYEIITLILIRRIFKDLSNLELTSDWFQVQNDLQFTYDITATLLLFGLIYIFYRLYRSDRKDTHASKISMQEKTPELNNFIHNKKMIAIFLVPVLMLLALFSFGRWVYLSFFSVSQLLDSIKDVNKIFFDQFFTILILTDVLLLLFSLFNTNQFHKVIRNSGFIISTILIRLSFGVDGLLNTILIVVAVSFGVIILAVHNQYEQLERSTNQISTKKEI